MAGATFLGCRFGPGVDRDLENRGALVLPTLRSVSLNTYRTDLYTPDDLYDTPSHLKSHDAHAYAWSRHATDRDAVLARTLHDHAIDDALAEWVADRTPGRRDGWARAAPRRAGVRRRGAVRARGGRPADGRHRRRSGCHGGGQPGRLHVGTAPEVAGRGATRLAKAPEFRPSVDDWLAPAHAVRARYPDGVDSLGIPTWYYGHEPTNVFATTIAKYFRNALRESMLVQICDGGVVFLPGAGGTVQEVFQDACENYYADESSVAPMVLVGVEYWTETVPAWPLLQSLARGRPMEPHVHLVDGIDEAAALVRA